MAINPALVREEQYIAMSGSQHQMLNEVINFFAAAASETFAATLLVVESIQALPFNITLMANCDDNVFFGNQVRYFDITGVNC